MSTAVQFYIITLLVYFGVNVIAGWALNLQFGVGGILNFGFIAFQAAGGYAAAVVTLGPSTASGYQSYVGGWSLPWPLPLVAAAVVGGLLAWLVGMVALRPARRDFQAIVLLSMSIIATVVVSSETSLFNGSAGLASIPQPFASEIGSSLTGYGWFYVGLTAVVCIAVLVVVRRLTGSPWSRRLRAIRDNPLSAAAIGIDVGRERMTAFIAGGALAAVSGAVLVEFVGQWAPSDWGYAETFVFFTAVVVGGVGNNLGVCVGTAVVWTGVTEGVRFLPQFSSSNLADALPGIVVGSVIVAFLWFRPSGLVPERRRRLRPRISQATDVETTTASRRQSPLELGR
jgi:branched-chain amino acid transport system permease protein